MANDAELSAKIGRRGLLLGAGAMGGAALMAATAAGSAEVANPPETGADCFVTPQQIDGPYYFNKELVRSDVTEGVPGIPLVVRVHIQDDGCSPVAGARADLWQADRFGIYSGAIEQGDDLNISTVGKTFLRGTQITNERGNAVFRSIYPGWYRGRTNHIHVKVYLDRSVVCTAQMYFPDALSEFIYANAPGYLRQFQRDKINGNDRRLKEALGHGYCSVQEAPNGYICDFTVGINRIAHPPQGLEKYPPGAPPRGPLLDAAARIKLLIPGS